jgi:hypothetical protein
VRFRAWRAMRRRCARKIDADRRKVKILSVGTYTLIWGALGVELVITVKEICGLPAA